MDYQQFYNLESYLLETVRPRFIKQGYLSAFDFFCIVIWKANRSKSKIAKRLKERHSSLETAVKEVTSSIFKMKNGNEKLRYLVKTWKFRLPMASAILTILYPDEFTPYDVRVREVLVDLPNLNNLSNFERLWKGYQEFKKRVSESAPSVLSLRDKDRYLWGKSFYNQLKREIKREFRSEE